MDPRFFDPMALCHHVLVCDDVEDGALWGANWALPRFEGVEWRVDFRTYQGKREKDVPLRELASPFQLVERPARFDTPELYLEWVRANGLRIRDGYEDWIMRSGPHQVAKSWADDEVIFVRAAERGFPCAYPGGYARAVRKEYPASAPIAAHGRFFVLFEDADDSSWNEYFEDEAPWRAAWETIREVPDLDDVDVRHLGLRA